METWLITGAGRGIGRALAVLLLERGERVVALVRAPEQLAALEAEHPGRLKVLRADMLDLASIDAAARSVTEPLDVVVANAGALGPVRQSTAEMDFAGFAETLAINTLAPLKTAQVFLPQLKRAQRPRIAVISSRMGTLSYAKSDHIAYRASKAAVNKVVQGLGTDLFTRGIAVAALHPGWARTAIGGPAAEISPEESAAGLLRVIDDLTPVSGGQFLNYDGTSIPW